MPGTHAGNIIFLGSGNKAYLNPPYDLVEHLRHGQHPGEHPKGNGLLDDHFTAYQRFQKVKAQDVVPQEFGHCLGKIDVIKDAHIWKNLDGESEEITAEGWQDMQTGCKIPAPTVMSKTAPSSGKPSPEL